MTGRPGSSASEPDHGTAGREENGAISPRELERLPLHPTQRLQLTHYLEQRERLHLGDARGLPASDVRESLRRIR